MNDATLAAQYAKTGDLMDLCNDAAWLREAARIEGSVEAGLAMRDYSQRVSALTSEQSQQLRRQMRVQSMLFVALREWMESWDLGAGFDATEVVARRCIRHHLAHPTPDQQVAIDRMLTADGGLASMSPSANPQAMAIVTEMLTQEDWRALAEVASQAIAARVLSTRGMQPEPTRG